MSTTPTLLAGLFFVATIVQVCTPAAAQTYEVPRQRTEAGRLVPTEPPAVTAATSEWQRNNEPIFVEGVYYKPAGPNAFFDGWTMVKIGTYRLVPIYVDTTLEPSTVVFVPIGRNVMKRYERQLPVGERAAP